MAEPQGFLADSSPLITAARLGKLRLVRLLVEGGAQVNEQNQRGETPLLAACRALRGNQSGSTMLKIIRFLLQNQADPNVQDKAGRTALMYACMERAGTDVVLALISAGADPSMEDYTGASALVYAINAREQDTIQALLDACRAKGRDIIIIATDLSSDGDPVTCRYLNVPPSPNTSPVSCMSPSDIELKTNSPGSEAEGENIFNFRASGKRGGSREDSPQPQEAEPSNRQRLHSEPWLAIHNLAHLSHTYEDSTSQGAVKEEEEAGSSYSEHPGRQQAARTSRPQPPAGPAHLKPNRSRARCRSPAAQPAPLGQDRPPSRRNTLPALTSEQCFLQLPALNLNLSTSDPHLHDPPCTITLPPVSPSRNLHNSSSCLSLAPSAAPCEFNTMRRWKPQEQLSLQPLACSAGFLPPLHINSVVNIFSGAPSSAPREADTQSHRSEDIKTNKPPQHHSGELKQMRQSSTEEILFIV